MLPLSTVNRSGATPDFPAMKYSYLELSKMIDHALLSPALTDQELEDGCRLAIRYQVASVCVKPYAVPHASQILAQTNVLVSCVVGFPHGNTTTASKRYETEQACQNGAAEIDMVINVGKALSGDWDYVENEIRVVSDETHRHGAKIKVILETDYLAQGGAGLSAEQLKRNLCQISERAGADWVKTSTGYGFVKQPDGNLRSIGATEQDLRLMRESVSEGVQVKASGGIRDLDGLIRVRDLGATRCGTSATVAILDEYHRRELAEKTGQLAPPSLDPKGASGSTADY
jgi:deoxyribose-phosphate aldolase